MIITANDIRTAAALLARLEGLGYMEQRLVEEEDAIVIQLNGPAGPCVLDGLVADSNPVRKLLLSRVRAHIRIVADKLTGLGVDIESWREP